MGTTDQSTLERLQKARLKKEKAPPAAIAKISAKKAKEIKEDKQLLLLDKEFYLEVWAASAHVCQNCGIGLPKEPSNFMFHHLLEKRTYPSFRHEHLNIAILCLECHSKCETNIDFAPKIKARREEVLKELLK